MAIHTLTNNLLIKHLKICIVILLIIISVCLSALHDVKTKVIFGINIIFGVGKEHEIYIFSQEYLSIPNLSDVLRIPLFQHAKMLSTY